MHFFFFDNCALQAILSSPKYEDILAKVEKCRSSKQARFGFSFLNFCERLVGVDWKHLGEVQDYLRKVYDFSGSVLLLPPKAHLGRVKDGPTYFKSWTSEELQQEGSLWTEFARKIVNAESFEEVQTNLSSFIDVMQQHKSSALVGYEAVRKRTDEHKVKVKKEGCKPLLANNKEEEKELTDKMFLDKLRKLGFLDESVSLNESDVEWLNSALPSVRYQAYVHYAFLKNMFRGAKPDAGHWFDFEQILYLDRCDYFVTEDKGLISLIDASQQPDLIGRALNVKMFLRSLTDNFSELPKRATLPVTNVVRFE